jgi:hypothetical protein
VQVCQELISDNYDIFYVNQLVIKLNLEANEGENGLTDG